MTNLPFWGERAKATACASLSLPPFLHIYSKDHISKLMSGYTLKHSSMFRKMKNRSNVAYQYNSFFPFKFVVSLTAGGVPNLAFFEGVDNEKVKT